MFSFVPTLKHEEDLKQAFNLLKSYDALRTTMVEFIMANQIAQAGKPKLEISGCAKAGDIQKKGLIKASEENEVPPRLYRGFLKWLNNN